MVMQNIALYNIVYIVACIITMEWIDCQVNTWKKINKAF